MDLRLGGRTVLVTGGSKGIGKATALGFAEEGARLAICARNETELEEAAEEIRAQTGAEVFAQRADLTSQEDTERFVSEAHRRFGRIDVLVNSAGQTRPGRFLELSESEWMASWAAKYFGCVRICRPVFRIMCEQRSGVILNVHGGSAYQPSEGFILKGNVNSAVLNFTVGLANEGSKFGVRAIAISPGPIRTEGIKPLLERSARDQAAGSSAGMLTPPLGRMGEAREVADLILFFASDRAAYIQGESIAIDGGLLRICR